MRIRHKKWWTAIVMVIVLTLCTSVVWGDSKTVKIQVEQVPMQFMFNGEQLAPPGTQQGFIYKGRTYIPIRFASYSLNQAVRWDNKTYTVRVVEPLEHEKKTIEQYNLANVVQKTPNSQQQKGEVKKATLTVSTETISYYFNNKKMTPPKGENGFLISGTLYVPLRFFSNSVGYQVDWDAKTFTVKANSATPKPDPKPDGNEQPDDTKTIGSGGTGGPGGGGAPADPVYDGIISGAQQQISALQNSCTSELNTLVNQFKNATNNTTKNNLISQGQSKLSSCDSSFESIMSQLQNELTSNGYGTGVINQYRAEYESIKDQAYSAIMAELF